MRSKAITFLFVSLIAYFAISLFLDSRIDKVQVTSKKKTTLNKYDEKSDWSERKKKIKDEANFDNPDKFAELHRNIRTRDGEDKPGYELNYRLNEYKKAKLQAKNLNKTAAAMAEVTFVERGPANTGGRTRGIHVDPDDPSKNTWFAASVGGGVWKTTDAGASWEIKTPDIPNLSMSYFGASAANTDVIYVGTGEGFFNVDAIEGNGIFKTVDHGETWEQLPSTVDNDFRYVNRIVVDPANEDIVIAATSNGIFKSVNGGISWTKVVSSGNFQDLISNPLNFNTLYASRNPGTIFKSKDAGDTWFESSEGTGSAARMEIDISPTDTNRLYISKELSFGGEGKLVMSFDAGENWKEINDLEGSTFEGEDYFRGQGWYDNAIAVHPYDENIVFYAGIDVWKATISIDSVKGIKEVQENGTETFLDYRAINLSFLRGGAGTGNEYWGEAVADEIDLVDVEIRFGPGMVQKAHMFENNSQYIDFIDVPFQVWDITNNRQLAVCYNDIRKNNVYDLSATRGDEIFIVNLDYDSLNTDPNLAVDDGLKYKNIYVITPKNLLGVAWDPTNHPESNIRIIAGNLPVALKESVPLTDWYGRYGQGADVHADQHELVMIPVNETTQEFRIVNSNDGGVAYSNDGGNTWSETDQNGYNTSQFYGADKKPGYSEYFGGMQDNGTWQSIPFIESVESTPYVYAIGGDGYEVAWHYKDPNKLIGGSQFNGIRRSVNGGNGWPNFEPASNGFIGFQDENLSPFVTKIASNNSDPDLLFAIIRGGVIRTDNFAESWKLSPIENLDAGGQWFSLAQVTISIANPQIVWAGAYMISNTTPNVSKDGGFEFNAVNGYSQSMGVISGLDTHPTDEATAYLTFSFSDAPKILRTTDYGQNWEDISGFGDGDESTTGFPDVATFCVVVMPFNTDIIWVGTDIGIVESTDNGATWHLLDSNFPSVSVWEMKIVDDQVVIATHGRGIWSATLPELSGYTPPVVTLPPRINGDVNVGTEGLRIEASLRSVYDSTNVMVGTVPIKTIFNTQVEDISIIAVTSETGQKSVYLKSYKDGVSYRSAASDIYIFEASNAQQGFYSAFNIDEDAFVLDGFTIAEDPGFSSSALQSPHDYEQQRTYLAILTTPIIVSNSDASLSYKDVAIIEKGETGTVYGDEEFWDYVIVEASNGSGWVPLLDGYDARADSKWLAAYDGGQAGDESMFKNHTINLLDKFSAGDTILIRFRLYSDPFSAGWGWLIDDLVIQGQFVDVEGSESLPTQFALNQNYPNPFNPSTTISFSLPMKSDVSIKIFDNIGQLVETLYNAETVPGYHNVTWDAKVASGIYYYTIKAGDFVQTRKMVLLK